MTLGSATARRRIEMAQRPARPGRRVLLALLHGFELTVDGQTMSVPPSAQRLIAFLAISDRRYPRAYVAGSLWPDAPERRAYSSLRSTLWRLSWPSSRLVDATNTHIALTPDSAVDFREAVDLARLTLDDSNDTGSVDRLLLLLSGDLLPGWYEDWVLAKREWFRQLRLHALECLSERLIRDGRFDQAVEAALLAVAAEPLRESAHRALLQAHIAEGNMGEALRDYGRYRDLLRRELGVAPSPLIERLVGRLMA